MASDNEIERSSPESMPDKSSGRLLEEAFVRPGDNATGKNLVGKQENTNLPAGALPSLEITGTKPQGSRPPESSNAPESLASPVSTKFNDGRGGSADAPTQVLSDTAERRPFNQPLPERLRAPASTEATQKSGDKSTQVENRELDQEQSKQQNTQEQPTMPAHDQHQTVPTHDHHHQTQPDISSQQLRSQDQSQSHSFGLQSEGAQAQAVGGDLPSQQADTRSNRSNESGKDLAKNITGDLTSRVADEMAVERVLGRTPTPQDTAKNTFLLSAGRFSREMDKPERDAAIKDLTTELKNLKRVTGEKGVTDTVTRLNNELERDKSPYYFSQSKNKTGGITLTVKRR